MFLEAGSTICLGCPQGTFASRNCSTMCLACSVGTFGATTGATYCSSCWTEATGPCQSVTTRNCTTCNSLRISGYPEQKPGVYLCRYSNSLQAPEFVCTVPDHGLKQKISCDYEDSMSCVVQLPRNSSSIRLSCQSSEPIISLWNCKRKKQSWNHLPFCSH